MLSAPAAAADAGWAQQQRAEETQSSSDLKEAKKSCDPVPAEVLPHLHLHLHRRHRH